MSKSERPSSLPAGVARITTPLFLASWLNGCVGLPHAQIREAEIPKATATAVLGESYLTVTLPPTLTANIDCFPMPASGLPVRSKEEQERSLSKILDFRDRLSGLINREGFLKGYQTVEDARVLDVNEVSSLPLDTQRDLLFHADPHSESNRFSIAFAGKNTDRQFQHFYGTIFYPNCGALSHTLLEARIRPELVADYLGSTALTYNDGIHPDKLRQVLERLINLPENTQWEAGTFIQYSKAVNAVKASGMYPESKRNVEAIIDSFGNLRLILSEPK